MLDQKSQIWSISKKKKKMLLSAGDSYKQPCANSLVNFVYNREQDSSNSYCLRLTVVDNGAEPSIRGDHIARNFKL